MYIPISNKVADIQKAFNLIEDNGFATIVTKQMAFHGQVICLSYSMHIVEIAGSCDAIWPRLTISGNILVRRKKYW